ncbi:MAG: DotU family type IV/VI secretion system protein [Planctomycetaceae bacterium]|nr:DotU family type IV/VI secretion system protein [Planctomycetaceae bacterium]
MTPSFAAAVDPVFLHVLGLLERISNSEPTTPSEERAAINNALRDAEAQLGQKQDWELAKYALVAWIDDVLLEAPWEGRKWWNENALEVELFNTRDRATIFYTKAKDAAAMTRRDALEVFYVCVVLGFRGLYRDQASTFLASQLSLPPDLEGWAKQAAKSIQLAQGRPSITEAPRPTDEGAPPLEGKYRMVGAALMGIVLTAVAALIWLFFLGGSLGGSAA